MLVRIIVCLIILFSFIGTPSQAGMEEYFMEPGKFKIELSYKYEKSEDYYNENGTVMPYWEGINMKRSLHMFYTEVWYGFRRGITVHSLFPIQYNTVSADAFAFTAEELEEFNRELNEYGIFSVRKYNDAGLGDINFGALFPLSRRENLTSFLDVTAVFPSGQWDHIDNIVDYPMGRGTYTIQGMWATDYTLLKEFMVGFYLTYGYSFARDHYMRIPESGEDNAIYTDLKGNLRVDHGNYFMLTGNFEYIFSRNFQFVFRPSFLHKWGDKVEGYEDVFFTYWLRQKDGHSWLGDAYVRFLGTGITSEPFMDVKVGLYWTMLAKNINKQVGFKAILGFYF